MSALAINLTRVLALMLELREDFFGDFCDYPVAALRLLHYLLQDPATAERERGENSSFP
jgi:isopenicillin N synthase-like dioxygenase